MKNRNDVKSLLKVPSLWLTFVLLVFLIMLISSAIIACVIFVLIQNNLITFGVPIRFAPMFIPLVFSVFIGTGISLMVGKRILRPITAISNASKEVAKGNFDIRVAESHLIDELEEIASNFNTMVHELGNMETMRSNFVASVSHEFKTPLAAIEGYITLLSDKNITDEEYKEYMNMIVFSTRQLSSLAENILKISKLENQNIILSKNNFRLDEQIRKALLLLEPQWAEKNIELDLDLDTTIFYGNEDLTFQIWTNLINNAIKFTHNNDKLTIILKTISHDDKEKILLQIRDNGIGMSEETQKHIFEKFYQDDPSRSVDGNGLGLALVKRVVDMHKGTIEVDSQLGKGSVFSIYLPVETLE